MTNAITTDELYAMLGLPNSPMIIDVRKAQAFDEIRRMLPGAQRGAPDQLAEWAVGLSKSTPIVVYCVYGHEVSKGAMASLCELGFNARYLEGGIVQWMESAMPTIARRPEWHAPGDAEHYSRWITRERPKIDRLACPWLVRRFIDPRADFFYVPATEVRAQAAILHAQPYDIPDMVFSHRGPLCSFDAFLAEFDLHDPALDMLAHIVRAADTGQLNAVPQAAGLLAISLGMAVNICEDAALLEAAMPMYDALYAWCKSASAKTHNWPFGATAQTS